MGEFSAGAVPDSVESCRDATVLAGLDIHFDGFRTRAGLSVLPMTQSDVIAGQTHRGASHRVNGKKTPCGGNFCMRRPVS